MRKGKAPTPVILNRAPRSIYLDAGDGRGVEGSLDSVVSRSRIKAFSRELPDTPLVMRASSRSFASHPNTRKSRALGTPDSPSCRQAALGLAQADRSRLLRRVLRIVIAALREIFDESAYERFLMRTHRNRSAASYREFLGEREASVARKPRCC